MKRVLATIGIVLGIIAAIIGIGFGTGYLNVGYTNTVGKAQQNANTNVFHSTQAYTDGAIADIAKVKLEYDQSADATARAGLVNYVRSSYPNLDPSLINNPIVRSWYQDIMDGSINN
jgi:purine nucleoside permease